ncbi:hypothetical protein [Roseococcus sp. YIM B11640]|uniref:hypothetical protein n=1 Tax=Roseococcus sp. YIM B11640 TaxID=3133973 RepID=UPI003C7D78B3
MTPRGACPSLAAPMETGDGLLLRAPGGEWSRDTALGIAEASRRYGNGVLEVTSRGNLQLRGLSRATAPACAEALLALGIADAPPILVNPLAGRDATLWADPRPIAAALAAAWPGGLPPKFTVVVDGGGALHLDAVRADLRLVATKAGDWWLGLGRATRWLGRVPGGDAAGAAWRALSVGAGGGTGPEPRPAAEPLGWHRAGALGLAAAFGSLEADTLRALAEALPDRAVLRPAPGRALLVLGVAEAGPLTGVAARLGLMTDPADPRRRVLACPGRPACGSGEAETRGLAAQLAALGGLPGGTLHISGCGKGCAHPGPAAVTLVGRAGGFDLIRAGGPHDLAACHLAPGEVATALKELR